MIAVQPQLRPDAPHVGILFAEDFDLPDGSLPGLVAEDPEPEVITPSFSLTELEAARAEGFEDGERAGREAERAGDESRSVAALANIGRALTDAAAVAAAAADARADKLARLLLAGFAALAPELCARHGEDEVVAIMRIVLPALRTEPRISVHVAPELADRILARLCDLEPDLLARIEVIRSTMTPGSVRVSWHDGDMIRDSDAILRAIGEALAPLGLAELLPVAAKSGTEAENGH